MRLLRGNQGWWCVAAAGTALVPDHHVVDGALTTSGLAAVRRTGVCTPRPVGHYSLTVLTATACNLGCSYCFQNTAPAGPGRFDPPRIGRATLTVATVDAIVSFTRTRMAEAGVDRLHVVLFGGEPLLNPDGCVAVLRSCGDIGLAGAAMLTNGVLLGPALARQLFDSGLRSVQITVDGAPEVHDTLRTTRRGRGTFRTIAANVVAAQETTDLDVALRVNLTDRALPGLPRLVEELAGSVDASRCTFAIAPVLDYGLGDNQSLHRSPTVAHQIVDAYALAQRRGFRLARPRYPHCDFCTAPGGATGAVVNADGTLYSCWETAGQPGYDVGDVHSGYTHRGPDRWLRCGVRAAAGPAGAFQDQVDAGVLDLIRAAPAATLPPMTIGSTREENDHVRRSAAGTEDG